MKLFFYLMIGGLCLPMMTLTAYASGRKAPFQPVKIPAWVYDVTRMGFCTPDELELASKAGVQVVHFNLVWPYYPLRRDGGGLPKEDSEKLRAFVNQCKRQGMKTVLGLPPFPAVEHVKAHPDWRVDPDGTGAALKVAPEEQNLGTRLGCNVGPWGDYLIEILAELMHDYGLDGYSFDGNYHSRICYCPACKAAYKSDTGKEIPKKADLDDIAYREYLVWRGEKLEEHYRKIQERLKGINPNAVLMTWTVNAGRYGHYLHSPRAMPTRMNLLIDLPMQEWWLDETNVGGSVVPAFGAAYLRATTGGRPNASEPYLMSRGNPYGTDSFPKHERVVRALLAMTQGSQAPEAFGWPGMRDSTMDVFEATAKRERWLTRTKQLPWAAMLVSEQTRQFYAYKDIAERHLPHLFGVFRAAMEEHLALNLINDWDVTPETLSPYRVLILPNSAALSNEQVEAIRAYVLNGGGLVATCETSLFDELGRPRHDFALSDVFGVSYQGRPRAPEARPELDANFAITVNEEYWRQRTGVATMTWSEGSSAEIVKDPRLNDLVPLRRVTFKGPQVKVSAPKDPAEVLMQMQPEGSTSPLPGVIVREYGKGRVVYMAAGMDAGYYSYWYPYERRVLARAIEWAAKEPFPIRVEAPMSVQSTFFEQNDKEGKRLVIHLFNGTDTTSNHGLPAVDVPLREEAVPIHGIRVRFEDIAARRFHVEPGGLTPKVRREGKATVVELPPLEVHAILVAELDEK